MNFSISTFMIFMLGIFFTEPPFCFHHDANLDGLHRHSEWPRALPRRPDRFDPHAARRLDAQSCRVSLARGIRLRHCRGRITQLAHLTLDVGQAAPVFDWIVSRAGMAFLWVPMNVMAFYFVPREKTNNATGLINLSRNIGGSIAISLVTTMLDRRAQFHQNRLVGNLRPGNPMFQTAMHRLTHIFTIHGLDAAGAALQAQRMLYQQLQRQATMLSFVDNFRLMAFLCVCVIPLMFLVRKDQAPQAGCRSCPLGSPSLRLPIGDAQYRICLIPHVPGQYHNCYYRFKGLESP